MQYSAQRESKNTRSVPNCKARDVYMRNCFSTAPSCLLLKRERLNGTGRTTSITSSSVPRVGFTSLTIFIAASPKYWAWTGNKAKLGIRHGYTMYTSLALPPIALRLSSPSSCVFVQSAGEKEPLIEPLMLQFHWFSPNFCKHPTLMINKIKKRCLVVFCVCVSILIGYTKQ